ncbi:MAG: hypothetical protein ABR568_05680 [Pyrinomonadaceae bacterium]
MGDKKEDETIYDKIRREAREEEEREEKRRKLQDEQLKRGRQGL